MYTKLCSKLWVALENLKQDVRGVTALEYVILAAIIIAALVLAAGNLDFNGWFGEIGSKVTDELAK